MILVFHIHTNTHTGELLPVSLFKALSWSFGNHRKFTDSRRVRRYLFIWTQPTRSHSMSLSSIKTKWKKAFVELWWKQKPYQNLRRPIHLIPPIRWYNRRCTRNCKCDRLKVVDNVQRSRSEFKDRMEYKWLKHKQKWIESSVFVISFCHC